jgi:drug/metabolite transporter (DMT)-like permease
VRAVAARAPLATLQVAALTGLALVCFAGNSLLCRAALGPGSIDPARFTAIRLGSGAALLAILTGGRIRGEWRTAFVMVLYAVPFSFAYVRLPTGAGALILFGSVQITMVGAAIAHGERPGLRAFAGLFLALAGLVWLALPSTHGASLLASLSMAVAGSMWGAYSLLARRAGSALIDTAGHFARTLPAAALLWFAAPAHAVQTSGIVFAVLSGAIASGVGYAIWATALPHLTATRAAVAQLLVPVLAAAGGIALLGERLTPRLAASAACILTGVALAMFGRRR